MGALANLPTLQDVQSQRRAVAKTDLPTRLATKTQADKADAKQLEAFRRAVAHRDRGRCRVCGVRTVVTLELVPTRREIHHIVSRTNPVVRTDPRNGITVCKFHHDRLTRHQLFIVGKAVDMFRAGRTSRSFLNADRPLQFVERKP